MIFADTYLGQRFNLSVTCSRLLCFYKEIYVFDYSILSFYLDYPPVIKGMRFEFS